MTEEFPILPKYAESNLSVIFHALRTPRRRLVLGILAHETIPSELDNFTKTGDSLARDTQVTIHLSNMARQVVSIERDIPVEQAQGETYRNCYNALKQTHLPQLEAVNAIQYNQDRQVVSDGKNLPALVLTVNITMPITQLLFLDNPDENDSIKPGFRG